jgi:hypothetical protein
MERYLYQPLSPGRVTRLLTVEPASAVDAPLLCSLKETEIGAEIKYFALSYVWGAAKGDRPLTCDGKTLYITLNCESALRHLRRKDLPLVIWIDAVCIDQTSPSDKNAQVSLMGLIYMHAYMVYVWLGESREGTEDLAQAILASRSYEFFLPSKFAMSLVARFTS